jgi:chloramphenicol 3-O-phosphotransferase
MCRRATDHLAWLERTHLTHRQRRLRVVVAKGNGVARQVLEDVAMAIELQFVVRVWFLKVGVDIELLAALQAHDAQPGAGQFHGHDRADHATADDDDIDSF